MEHGNMLAIVGSPGSGKTTLAVKLAAEIAKKKKNVIVVCSDPFVPSVPFLLPMDTEQEVSLGALLTAPSLTQNKILEACVPVPANEYISLLGYRMGENLMSYPKVTRERAVEFLVCLRHLADYVILDCTSVFEADVFSILAMEMADRVLRVGTSNLRGISYFKSHAGMLEGRADNGKYINYGGALTGLCMFDTCKNQEAAWKWITYMCGQEANSYWNKSIGQLPTNTACYNDDWMKDMQHIQCAIETTSQDNCLTYTSPAYLPDWGSINSTYIEPGIQSVMSGDMTAKELLDMWAEHLNEAYANYMAN